MKSAITLLALALCTTTALAQASKAQILPDSFILHNAVTANSIKTLLHSDGNGMYLSPTTLIGAPDAQYEVGLEVIGFTKQHPTHLSFGVSQTAYSGNVIVHRIEMFNYTTNAWDRVAWASSGSPSATDVPVGRPYIAPFTYAQVKAANYIDPEMGEVRTRVFWTSPTPFRTVWIDYAGWRYSWE